MKTYFQWLFAFTFLFSGICASHAMPKADLDYMQAIFLYNTGINQISSNPQAGIKSLEQAEQCIQSAIADGAAGYQVEHLSQLIGHALMVAEIKQRTGPVVNMATVKKLLRSGKSLSPYGSPAT